MPDTFRLSAMFDLGGGGTGRTRRAVIAALAGVGAGCAGLGPGATPSETTVRPDADDAQYENPGRGWVLTGVPEAYDGAEAVFPYAAVGYTRFSWSAIQYGPNEFDWGIVDDFVEGWADRGMTAAFGVAAASSHSPADHPFVTPKWVFESGAAHETVTMTEDMNYAGTPGEKVVPDFDDPVFLEALSTFVAAMADRYDGDDRVEFVDVRSYGNWGETHMWPFAALDDDVYDPLSVESFIDHVRIHTEAFDETQLLLPSKGEDHEHAEVDAWALDHGVGLRRDGVIASSDGSETARALGEEPAAFEWHGDYEWLRSRGYWDGSDADPESGFPLEECVERGHPSYVGFNHYGGAEGARRFLENERELVDELSRRIGYRFELREATVPTTLPRDQAVEVSATWRNVGVAPIYRPADVAVGLVDADDETVARRWLAADPTTWMPDESVTTTDEVTVADVDPGDYRLAVGVFTDRRHTTPDVRLGVDTDRVDRWHVLADVEAV